MPSRDARERSDAPGRREPTECEKDRAEALGTFSARAHREEEKQCGACGCGGHALRAGRRVSSANVTSRSAPHTKRTRHETAVYTALHLVLCSARTYTAQPHVVTPSFLPSFHPSFPQ